MNFPSRSRSSSPVHIRRVRHLPLTEACARLLPPVASRDAIHWPELYLLDLGPLVHMMGLFHRT